MATERLFDRISAIELAGVTKRYGDDVAVDCLDLRIEGGELVILIGASGSGKTTTLRMINRLIEPDEGRVTINGTDTREIDPVALRRNTGYVIQQIGLFPHMSVGENVGLVPTIEGWERGRIRAQVERLLDLVDLPPETYYARFPRELSGGQQQRVGLARALAMDPPLLLMDEPFGALDPILRKQLQDEFSRIKADLGRTIVFVTHDIDEAFKLGDRIAIMHDARLVQVGTPEDLIFNPASDVVAHMVDADRKFRHIDTLSVRDLMTPVLRRHLFPAATGVHSGLETMMASDIGVAIVTDGEEVVGAVRRREAYTRRHEELTMGEIAAMPLTFSPHDAGSAALAELKHSGHSFGLVVDDKKPVGLFLSDEVLMRLI
ncbi:ABC transporter ATP-binding protein [Methanofollis tationis]|uniref:Molybdate/tungstate import ATP-binding protein WtpC n=1 Tax=Methanofollis tationis TaxID=81417 RepID=A0A7K4HLI0_9EURY|nr:ATP-binding cassette domain-containing protein [Methanofollis tationis]NVO65907.1 ATP-binding cassette domain-containing protein [Methanofollis tationis]